MEKKVNEVKNEYTMTSPNSRVFRLCKQLNQNYPERVVSFNENVTSCTCEDFTRKQTMIKDPAKKVTTYNSKHIVFILRVAAGNVLLGKHCLTDDDVNVINNLQQ